MPTTTAPKHTDAQRYALKEHAKLVAECPVKTGAVKAGVSGKINRLQVEMLLPIEFGGYGLRMVDPARTEGSNDEERMAAARAVVESGEADFVAWVKPVEYTQRYAETPQELASRVTGLRALFARDDRPESVKGNVEDQLRDTLDKISARKDKGAWDETEVPDGHVPAPRAQGTLEPTCGRLTRSHVSHPRL